jgi:hypothetical protein
MTERADETARNVARNAIRDIIDDGFDFPSKADSYADYVVDDFTVTWERDVNGHGVAVRRYVLRGAWEVDPAAATRGTDAIDHAIDHAIDQKRNGTTGVATQHLLSTLYNRIQSLGDSGLHVKNDINRHEALEVIREAMHEHGVRP